MIPRYCIILPSVTPDAAPSMSSMADLSQFILLNNDSIPDKNSTLIRAKIQNIESDYKKQGQNLKSEIDIMSSAKDKKSYQKHVLTLIYSLKNG